MRIAVVGANGRTGASVVEQAVARGHEVIAVVRRPETMTIARPGVRVKVADVLIAQQVRAALAGAHAVVSTLGAGAGREPTSVYSVGTANLLSAMRAAGTQRLVVISAVPAGPRRLHGVLDRGFTLPLLELFFGAGYADMRRMEAQLQSTSTEWTSVRAPRLLAKPGTGTYRLAADYPLAHGRSIATADLAGALLDMIDRTELYRRAVYVAA